jgi:hypothetical protein
MTRGQKGVVLLVYLLSLLALGSVFSERASHARGREPGPPAQAARAGTRVDHALAAVDGAIGRGDTAGAERAPTLEP